MSTAVASLTSIPHVKDVVDSLILETCKSQFDAPVIMSQAAQADDVLLDKTTKKRSRDEETPEGSVDLEGDDSSDSDSDSEEDPEPVQTKPALAKPVSKPVQSPKPPTPKKAKVSSETSEEDESPVGRLVSAIRSRKLADIEKRLEMVKDINAKDAHGISPLVKACETCQSTLLLCGRCCL